MKSMDKLQSIHEYYPRFLNEPEGLESPVYAKSPQDAAIKFVSECEHAGEKLFGIKADAVSVSEVVINGTSYRVCNGEIVE